MAVHTVCTVVAYPMHHSQNTSTSVLYVILAPTRYIVALQTESSSLGREVAVWHAGHVHSALLERTADELILPCVRVSR